MILESFKDLNYLILKIKINSILKKTDHPILILKLILKVKVFN
jgi:hypothetical protein